MARCAKRDSNLRSIRTEGSQTHRTEACTAFSRFTGRSDATSASWPSRISSNMVEQDNISFRIPTPRLRRGFNREASATTRSSPIKPPEAAGDRFLGISGLPNRSGNDGSITRFGWKAQNKSLLMFAGEAYNVEMGITNEIFPNERGYPPTPLPAGCLINPTPEDTTNFDVTSTVAGPSDIVAFSNFMRFLDQPAPSCTGTGCSQSIQNGRNLFINVAKCSVCHTPSMTTGTSYVAALSNIQANLFSDLLIHHMGSGLADGVSQGGAGPDQFRTAPLWGLGQRLFFLHDGRTADLMQAIEDHAGPGSEANTVIRDIQRPDGKPEAGLAEFPAFALSALREAGMRGLCSARLQAGICSMPRCPPEGGRYNILAMCRHTDPHHTSPVGVTHRPRLSALCPQRAQVSSIARPWKAGCRRPRMQSRTAG